jgi:prepilin-type N-terminal cleavage/methylation domain-containing protein
MVIPLQDTRTKMERRARGDGGFTLTEVMVVLVILGVLSAVAAPRFTKDRFAAEGREFADILTRELQRARLEAITTRLPQYAFLFSDRIELRSARPGITPTAPLVAPTTTDPILRIVRAKPGMSLLDVTTSTAVTTGISGGKQLAFSTLGVGFIAPPATPPTVPTAVYVHLRNTAVASNHPDYSFRIDVAPLTGYVRKFGQQ